MLSQFDAPIPGESLTKAPGSMPYERPPEISDPEEAIQMHLMRLSKPEMMQDMMDMLELDVDVVTLTEGILRSAVATGVHSIDVSLAIAPVIHEFIKTSAEDAGIEFNEGLDDPKAKEKRKAITKAKAAKMIEKFRKEKKNKKEQPIEEEPAMEEPMDMPVESKGFFKRRGEA